MTLKKGMTFEIETLKTKEAGMYYTTYSQKFPSPFAEANPKKDIFVHKLKCLAIYVDFAKFKF